MTAEIQILDECEERFNILKASNRGYHFQFRQVARARQKAFTDGDVPALNFYAASDSLISKSYDIELRKLIVSVEAHAISEDPFMDTASKLAADIVVAIYRSPTAPRVSDTPSPKLGYLVESITIADKEFFIREGMGTWAATAVTIDVQYKVRAGETVLFIG